MFQSTRPRGARPTSSSAGWPIRSFNPRAHAGRDTSPRTTDAETAFQSTRPRGARPAATCEQTSAASFNPRAHAGRDLDAAAAAGALIVSIHAPTRGATRAGRTRCRARCCFNPRAHAGRDISPFRSRATAALFQSTRPRGARLSLLTTSSTLTSFNPRAHAGRDRRLAARSWPRCCFNPRAHAGRDAHNRRNKVMYLLFQSTRPRGARPAVRPPAGKGRCFNPRAHAGRDSGLRAPQSGLKVSIHAPTRGATRVKYDVISRCEFQSTRPRGARPPRRPA